MTDLQAVLDKHETGASERTSPRQVAGAVALIAAAAFYSPLSTWAVNGPEVASPLKLFAIGAIAWCLGLLVLYLSRRIGVPFQPATHLAVVLVLLLMGSGSVIAGYPAAVGVVGVLALLGLAAMILIRLGASRPTRFLMLWLGMFLALSPPVSAATRIVTQPRVGASLGAEPPPVSLSVVRPDIFVIVFDAYGGSRGLTSRYSYENEVLPLLAGRGFQVPESAWTAYSATHASIPSLLDMSHPILGETPDAATLLPRLYRISGGENNLVGILRESGYRITMLENPWAGSQCANGIDDCLAGPILDDAAYAVLEKTVVGPYLRARAGHPYVDAALSAMSWFDTEGVALAGNGRPDLVVSHILVPHPPFQLDAGCNVRIIEAIEPVAVLQPAATEEEASLRRAAYLEQVRCVNSFIEALTARLPTDTVVVLTADHGPDGYGQLFRPLSEWSIDDWRERMNVFLAVGGLGDCPIPEPILLPNVMRQVLACVSAQDIPDLSNQMFATSEVEDSWVEVDPAIVDTLLSER